MLVKCLLDYYIGICAQKGGAVLEHWGNREKEWMMKQVLSHCPTVRQILSDFGEVTLESYISQVADFPMQQPLAPVQDVAVCTKDQLVPLLGEQAAADAAAAFVDCAFTAPHHGVDSFAPSVQGNLLYRRLLEQRGGKAKVVPVLAFGLVSLCNASYGRGLLIYDTLTGNAPLKLPVIPSKYENSVVSFFPGFNREMIQKSGKTLAGHFQAGCLSEKMTEAVQHILDNHYACADVLKKERYIEQATIINYSLTKEAMGVAVAYVDAERLAAQLILKDLQEKDSLVSLIMGNRRFRQEVFTALDGFSGCWRRAVLKKGYGGGTMLFWGKNEKLYRRSAMMDDGGGLVSVSDGRRIAYEEIPEALEAGELLPGLFLIFLELLFVRGFHCFGGYFQAEYLKQMQAGLCKALQATGQRGLAEIIAKRRTDGYLSGPFFFVNEDGVPWGIAEFITHPLKEGVLQEKMNLSVREAHFNGIGELFKTVVPAAERKGGRS